MYHERWLTSLLREAAADHPVVVLTGARQVGKSTLLRHAAPFRDWRYRTLDDADTQRQADEDPTGLWAGARGVVLDEVQRAPTLLGAVKHAVDEDRDRRFVLSGSANLLLMRQVSESLAGRAVTFVLDPMALGERADAEAPNVLCDALFGRWPEDGPVPDPPGDPVPVMLRGLMPALLALDNPTAWVRWWDGYVTTYLERDLRQLTQIVALPDFRRVMQFLALRSGQLMNQTEVGRDARIAQPTVHRYANLLETTHLMVRLPAYTASHTTTLLRTPKVMWTDPGLAVFLAGYYDAGDLARARELGAFFEILIYLHIRVLASLLTPCPQVHFWRTRAGQEVDFVVVHGRRVLALEVKMTDRPGYRHADGLRLFLDRHPDAVGGLLVHGGPTVERLGERVVAVPWTMLTG
jgi:uncharacterized protein